ncbi:MAG TPA: DUF2007 domain-containing protein [Planctomycetota bacterium]|nr:DUF2007 domain-containing protein [Planctomycetota bacterium]
MKRVYSTGSLQEAELLRVSLRQNGIESDLENEYSSLFVVPAATVPLIIIVADEDFDGAVHVIRKHLARRETPK